MGRSRIVAALVAAVAGAGIAASQAVATEPVDGWTPYSRPAELGVVEERDVPVRTHDGTILSANVLRPDRPGRYPVVITQTPYGKDGPTGLFLGRANDFLVSRGYVQVIVDVRGTGSSAGQWDSFGEDEQQDGYDVVEWAAAQPWSDGKVGLTGPSYMGFNQLLTAARKPPHLEAIFPIVPMADGYRDITFSGGDINASFIPLWLGLVSAGSLAPAPHTTDGTLQGLTRGVTTLAQHASGIAGFQASTLLNSIAGGDVTYDGPFWKTRSPLEVVDRVDVPAFVVGGLHDLFQRGTPLIYERLRGRVPTKLVMGPWTHVSGSQGAGLAAAGMPSIGDLQLRWFDHWLKGMDTGIDRIPAVTQWTSGLDRYETQQDWPHVKLDPERWHLRSGGRLERGKPSGAEVAQSFVQHPLSGICTLSLGQWTAGLAEPLPCFSDERPNELAGGVRYTSAPLERDLRLSGPVAARVWLTTTASDAAVTVRVQDVAPSGKVTALSNGWQSAGFRAVDASRTREVRGHVVQPWHPFTRESVRPVRAGEPTALDVEVFPLNAVVRKGHRLQVTIDPADFPHLVPTLPALSRRLGGRVSILTGPDHASSVTLPVVGDTCANPVKPKAQGKKKKKKAAKKRATAKRKAKGRPKRAKRRQAAACAPLPVPDLVRG